VVSLAAGMALPAATNRGDPFPGRDLLVFLTFAVILATLVGQGLTLAPLIKWLGVRPDRHEEREEIKARIALAEAAQLRIAQLAEEARLQIGRASCRGGGEWGAGGG